jgi:DNA polymerase-3 subunit delta'
VSATDVEAVDPWADIVGQTRAVARLRASVASPVHAYLLVGPAGSGKREVARAFAADLLGAGSPSEARARHIRLAKAERHPDLTVVERLGTAMVDEEASELIRLAMRTPVEGQRKVIVGAGFEAIGPKAAARLLKIVEEPPPSTVFVLTAEDVPPEIETIASRCVRIDLDPLPASVVAERLVAEGVDEATAADAARAAGGDLGRARLLVTDPRLALRRRAWWSVPDALDDTGATVARLVAELRAHVDDAQAALDARHQRELAELDERAARFGERGAGRADLVARQKREVRRHRTDEIRFGLATLAARFRDAAAAGDRPAACVDAVDAIHEAAESLLRNPNEALLLQALFLRLPALG